MVNFGNCSFCIHKDICSIKDVVSSVKDKVSKEFEEYNDYVDISVSCKKYHNDTNWR